MSDPLLTRARDLPCWTAPEGARFLAGGKTNHNILLTDQGRHFVVRFGADIPEHGILRWHELAVSRAAAAAGVAPGVHHAGPGVLVLDYVEARPLTPEDIARPGGIEALADLIARAHRDVARHMAGPALAFWVFHVIRDYARTLRAGLAASGVAARPAGSGRGVGAGDRPGGDGDGP